MHVDFISVLPEAFAPMMGLSVVGRAAEAGRFTWRAIPVRAFAEGKHRITDEPPFGGGAGMVMKVEPLVRAIRWASHHGPEVAAPSADATAHEAPRDRVTSDDTRVVLLDAGGRTFSQGVAREYAGLKRLILVCGRYEGVDHRVRRHVDEELSVGDYVLTGGELAALVVTDAVVRLLPGALGNPASTLEESHGAGMIEYPQYTRPREFEGEAVPEILFSGDHARIAQWRREQSVIRTRERRKG